MVFKGIKYIDVLGSVGEFDWLLRNGVNIFLVVHVQHASLHGLTIPVNVY